MSNFYPKRWRRISITNKQRLMRKKNAFFYILSFLFFLHIFTEIMYLNSFPFHHFQHYGLHSPHQLWIKRLNIENEKVSRMENVAKYKVWKHCHIMNITFKNEWIQKTKNKKWNEKEVKIIIIIMTTLANDRYEW